jgi:hypothetical protein
MLKSMTAFCISSLQSNFMNCAHWTQNRKVNKNEHYSISACSFSETNLSSSKKSASLGTNWIENDRFGLVFAKTSVSRPKLGL